MTSKDYLEAHRRGLELIKNEPSIQKRRELFINWRNYFMAFVEAEAPNRRNELITLNNIYEGEFKFTDEILDSYFNFIDNILRSETD